MSDKEYSAPVKIYIKHEHISTLGDAMKQMEKAIDKTCVDCKNNVHVAIAWLRIREIIKRVVEVQ